MPDALTLIAVFATTLSAAALYAGSRHCLWPSLRRLGKAGTWSGVVIAVIALTVWMAALGVGIGACAMLGTWMLALALLPWIASLTAARSGDSR